MSCQGMSDVFHTQRTSTHLQRRLLVFWYAYNEDLISALRLIHPLHLRMGMVH